LLVLIFSRSKPDELFGDLPKQQLNTTLSDQAHALKERHDSVLTPQGLHSSVAARGIGFFEAWLIPGVFKFSIVYLCVKGTVYGLMFYLPTYLQDSPFEDVES
jgi:hypothetical protein